MKRVALVTGGTRGIGFGIAQALAREGFDLAVCGRREERAVREALKALRLLGAETLYCQCDVARREARTRMLTTIQQRFGRLHVLVNNVGIAPKERHDILEATEESFEDVLRTNLQGPYFLTQSVAKWMVEQKRADANFAGCFINVSSISATVVSVDRGEYCISKAGVSMATQLWAARLAPEGIVVYEVRPGVVATSMTAGATAKYDALFAAGLAPMPRWGRPADVAGAVGMLVAGKTPYSTGEIFHVDGGMHIPRL